METYKDITWESVLKDINADSYLFDLFLKEPHHQHGIVENNRGVLCWKPNPYVASLVDKMNLNQIVMLLEHMGIDRNHETYRKLYRDMGYALFGYWEIFFWEENNPDAELYKAPNNSSTKYPKTYVDEKFCKHCEKDTDHEITEYGHERDSSADTFMCLVCHWHGNGMFSQYHPPFTEH